MGTSRFTRISDLHLTKPQASTWKELCGKRLFGYLSWLKNRRLEHRPEVLQVLQKAITTKDRGPVLITGDLTQIGLPQEFAEALRFLQGLGSPAEVLLVPGNHDSYGPTEASQTYALWRDYLGGLKSESPGPRFEQSGDCDFIGLDSALPTGFFQATGRLGKEQLANLEDLLARPRSEPRFRVLYLHHPPQEAATSWRKRLVDSQDLLRLLEEHPVELVLHGHEHESQLGELKSAGRSIPVLGIASASALGRKAQARRAAFHRHEVTLVAGHWQLKIWEERFNPDTQTFALSESWDFSIPAINA